MIKRLFRTWLRVRLYQHIGDHTQFEETFKWIYKSPIWEWNTKIYCLMETKEYVNGWIDSCSYGTVKTVYHIDEAERLLNFFHK